MAHLRSIALVVVAATLVGVAPPPCGPPQPETEKLWPGAHYGLGLFSRPLPCGGTYWAPAGDQDGYSTRAGIAADGRVAVTASMSAQLRDSIDSVLRQEQASHIHISRALCGPVRPGEEEA